MTNSYGRSFTVLLSPSCRLGPPKPQDPTTVCLLSRSSCVRSEGPPSIRFRYNIAFQRHIQDPEIEVAIAYESMANDRFDDVRHKMNRAFRWVYGEHPWKVMAEYSQRVEEDYARPLISIRQWVFGYN
jgi:hypothetical protein